MGLTEVIRQPALRKVTLSLASALLVACASTETVPPSAVTRQTGGKSGQAQLRFQLASGTYLCELGQTVEVQRDADGADRLQLSWQGNRHTLQRLDSKSGLPRFEDRKNGLLWIDLPWKSVLLDAHSGRPLANECKAPHRKTASADGIAQACDTRDQVGTSTPSSSLSAPTRSKSLVSQCASLSLL